MSVAPVGGRYRLIERIGTGGMGHVWRAYDDVLRREVAVKEVRLPAGLSDADLSELRQRTLREARTAARLNHPNVVRVYDVLYADDRPWIVMEYVASRSLATVVRDQGALAPELVARIGLALLYALTAAHQAGVLHRDVKPGNVLLANDGRIMLTDFGLATFDEAGLHLTQTGVVYGSPQFIAPERAHDGSSSIAADLWSLGATMYAAVEGRSPYARSSSYATLAALATTTPDPPLHAGVLTPILGGLLIRNPKNRMNADEVRRRLERIIAADAGTVRQIELPPRHARETPDITPPRIVPPMTGAPPTTPMLIPQPRSGEPRRAEPEPGELITRGSLTRASRAGMAGDGGPLPVADASASSRAGASTLGRPAGATEAHAPKKTDALIVPTVRTEVAQIVDAVTSRITHPDDVASVSTPPATDPGWPDSPSGDGARNAERDALPSRTARHAAPQLPEKDAPDPEPFIMLGGSPASWSTPEPGPNRGRRSTRSPKDNRRPNRWAPATFIAVVAMVLAIVAVIHSNMLGSHQNPAANAGAPGGGPGGGPSAPPAGPPPSPFGGAPPGPPPGPNGSPPPATNLIWFCKPTVAPATTAIPSSHPLPGAKAIPKSWIWYVGTTGYRIAVPATWRVAAGNPTDCIYDPYNGRVIGVNAWTTSVKDPAEALLSRETESLSLGGLPGYQRVKIADVSCKVKCADWIYTYVGPLAMLETHVRMFLDRDGTAEVVSFTTVASDYTANTANFNRIVGSLVY